MTERKKKNVVEYAHIIFSKNEGRSSQYNRERKREKNNIPAIWKQETSAVLYMHV